jgi:hypothetical protein
LEPVLTMDLTVASSEGLNFPDYHHLVERKRKKKKRKTEA